MEVVVEHKYCGRGTISSIDFYNNMAVISVMWNNGNHGEYFADELEFIHGPNMETE